MGPYETEQAAAAEEMPRAAAEEMPRAAREMRQRLGQHNLDRDVRDLLLSFLRDACTDAGVELGRYDQRILTWLANYESAVTAGAFFCSLPLL